MNARARDLAVLLRGILGMLPGATSIGLHASERWAFVMITAASDEAVVALGEALGLTCDVRRGKRISFGTTRPDLIVARLVFDIVQTDGYRGGDRGRPAGIAS